MTSSASTKLRSLGAACALGFMLVPGVAHAAPTSPATPPPLQSLPQAPAEVEPAPEPVVTPQPVVPPTTPPTPPPPAPAPGPVEPEEEEEVPAPAPTSTPRPVPPAPAPEKAPQPTPTRVPEKHPETPTRIPERPAVPTRAPAPAPTSSNPDPTVRPSLPTAESTSPELAEGEEIVEVDGVFYVADAKGSLVRKSFIEGKTPVKRGTVTVVPAAPQNDDSWWSWWYVPLGLIGAGVPAGIYARKHVHNFRNNAEMTDS